MLDWFDGFEGFFLGGILEFVVEVGDVVGFCGFCGLFGLWDTRGEEGELTVF